MLNSSVIKGNFYGFAMDLKIIKDRTLQQLVLELKQLVTKQTNSCKIFIILK